MPGDIKSQTSDIKFKEYIDTWFDLNVCMNIWNSISVKYKSTLVGGVSYTLMFLPIFEFEFDPVHTTVSFVDIKL